MDNMTLVIDTETRDLVFDEDGHFKKIFEDDTTIQNVRHALLTWKAEFFADETHGADYERIMGTSENDIDNDEIEEIIREAVFQEPEVSRVDAIVVSYENRFISVEISATLKNDTVIRLGVTV
jgi:hypothetical protein